jgi:Predicted transcriptional regulator
MKTKVGEALWEMRKSQRLTQNELAEYFGVSRGSIQNYERDIQYPSLDTLLKYQRKFKFSIDELFNINVKRDISPELLREISKQSIEWQDTILVLLKTHYH